MNLFKKISIIVIVAYSIILIWYFASNSNQYQWDFRVYYYAAEAYSQGLNPYDQANLSELASVPISLKFVYPPLTLLLFRVFLIFDYESAYYVFLLIKLVILAFLILLWSKEFITGNDRILFYLICLFGFNSAIVVDIMAGNVSIMEQLLIWLSFYFLLKEKPLLFNILLIGASFLKIAPIAFLILNLIILKEKRFRYFLGGISAFVIVLALNFIYDPLMFKEFIINAGGLYERGIINPSTFALIRDPFELLTIRTGIVIPAYFAVCIYVFVLIAVSATSWKLIKIIMRSDLYDKNTIVIYFVCIVFAILIPRFKSYSYILLLVPAFYAIKVIEFKNVTPFLVIAFILTTPSKWNIPGTHYVIRAIWEYYSLLLAYALWGLYIYMITVKNDLKISGLEKIDN